MDFSSRFSFDSSSSSDYSGSAALVLAFRLLRLFFFFYNIFFFQTSQTYVLFDHDRLVILFRIRARYFDLFTIFRRRVFRFCRDSETRANQFPISVTVYRVFFRRKPKRFVRSPPPFPVATVRCEFEAEPPAKGGGRRWFFPTDGVLTPCKLRSYPISLRIYRAFRRRSR